MTEERLNAVLAAARVHPLQKCPQRCLRLQIVTEHLHPAAESDELANRRVHHRHCLPHRLIQPQLATALGRKVPQLREGMRLPAPQLYRLRGKPCISPLPEFQTNHSSLVETLLPSPRAHPAFVARFCATNEKFFIFSLCAHARRSTAATANPPLRFPVRSMAKYRISSIA